MKKIFTTFFKNDEGKPFTAEEAIIFGGDSSWIIHTVVRMPQYNSKRNQLNIK